MCFTRSFRQIRIFYVCFRVITFLLIAHIYYDLLFCRIIDFALIVSLVSQEIFLRTLMNTDVELSRNIHACIPATVNLFWSHVKIVRDR